MKMFHILSEFTPSSEEHNYLLPVPNDFKIIGHYTVSRDSCSYKSTQNWFFKLFFSHVTIFNGPVPPIIIVSR